MSQTNHQLARRFFEALSNGEIPDALLTPDLHSADPGRHFGVISAAGQAAD